MKQGSCEGFQHKFEPINSNSNVPTNIQFQHVWWHVMIASTKKKIKIRDNKLTLIFNYWFTCNMNTFIN